MASTETIVYIGDGRELYKKYSEILGLPLRDNVKLANVNWITVDGKTTYFIQDRSDAPSSKLVASIISKTTNIYQV